MNFPMYVLQQQQKKKPVHFTAEKVEQLKKKKHAWIKILNKSHLGETIFYCTFNMFLSPGKRFKVHTCGVKLHYTVL